MLYEFLQDKETLCLLAQRLPLSTRRRKTSCQVHVLHVDKVSGDDCQTSSVCHRACGFEAFAAWSMQSDSYITNENCLRPVDKSHTFHKQVCSIPDVGGRDVADLISEVQVVRLYRQAPNQFVQSKFAKPCLILL